MNLVSIGISHHTASVDVREKMWFSADETREALRRLKEGLFSECVLVSTCNRTELYGIAADPSVSEDGLKSFLINFKKAGGTVRPEHFIGANAGSAVEHLFQVAAGIDSLVIGDIQILSQVKEAFTLSRESEALGPVLSRLMQSSLHVGKRVRTESSICEGAVSVSYAAAELAGKIFAELAKKSSLLIGAGETGELTLRHLVGKGIGTVLIANRTREKADALAAEFGGQVIDYERMADGLKQVDIVIASVTSPSYVVRPDDVQQVMRQRLNNPLFIIDIGVPRNVDPSARKIENVFLYDMDSLSSIVDRNLEKRKSEIPKVAAIIREELGEFLRWHESLQVGPTIHDLRDTFEAIRQAEVEKNIHRFRPEDRELVELVTRRIVNKILHQPMTVLRQGTNHSGGSQEVLVLMKSLRDLFGISPERKGEEDV